MQKTVKHIPVYIDSTPIPMPTTPKLEFIVETTRWQRIVRWFTWKKTMLLSLTLVILGIAGTAYYLLAKTTQQVIHTTQPSSLFQQLQGLFGEHNPLQGETDDRVNVVLLGIGGDGHDGGQLTDTIMVASIKPSTKQVALLSLPRDLIVKYYNDDNPKWYEYHKINNAYAWGGMDLVTEKVSDVTGLTLHYYILLDFSGFNQLIDDVGGLDVTVDRAFTGVYGTKDLSTPCPKAQLRQLSDGSYCAIQFDQGDQHMDGEHALMFARIRKSDPQANNNPLDEEDFGRSQRQQKILESFKAKVLSANTLLRPDRITTMLNDIGTHLQTNLQLSNMARVAELVLDIPRDQIISKVVDEKTTQLVESKYDTTYHSWNVVPRAGTTDYSEIQALAANIFVLPKTTAVADQITNATTPTSTEPITPAKVQILNGTPKNGLASKTAETLKPLDITITGIGNAPGEKTIETTLIYDFSDGQRPAALNTLTKATGLTVASATQLDALLGATDSEQVLDTSVHFVIILGTDTISNPITLQQ